MSNIKPNLHMLAMVPDTGLVELATRMGITCTEPSVMTYPDERTRKAFMQASYGDASLAHKIIREREHG